MVKQQLLPSKHNMSVIYLNIRFVWRSQNINQVHLKTFSSKALIVLDYFQHDISVNLFGEQEIKTCSECDTKTKVSSFF